MPALKIDHFLAAGGEFLPVMEKAREIEALSELLKGFLPPELAPLARVANFKEGKLVIHAVNGPAAAKLKLLAESLGAYITKRRSEVNSVLVRVQPAGPEAPITFQKRAELTAAALQELAALYSRLSDSPFRNALKTLLKSRGFRP